MGEPDRAQREKGPRGLVGKRRDRCREEEIRPRGQSVSREEALGEGEKESSRDHEYRQTG